MPDLSDLLGEIGSDLYSFVELIVDLQINLA